MDGWQTQVVTSSTAEVVSAYQLTVLLPTFNEELAIEPVLDEIVAALAKESLRYEILVVDDASTDATADLAERYAADCWQCPVRVIRCPENRGAGAARKVGIRNALGDVVVMLDADGTYPAASIPICSSIFRFTTR